MHLRTGADADIWFGLAAGSHLRTNIVVGGQLKNVADYATVQGIFIGIVVAYVIVVTIFGPEYVVCFTFPVTCSTYGRYRHHASHFEKHKTAFEEGGGQDDAFMEGEGPEASETREDDEKVSDV